MARKMYTVKNTTFRFRDFKGTKFGPGGARNFTIYLTPQEAASLSNEGFNVRYPEPTEEYPDPVPTLKIKVSLHEGDGLEFLNPSIWTVGSTGGKPVEIVSAREPITPATKNLVDMLDHLVVEKVDVTFTGSRWTNAGASGVTAYAQSVLITYVSDPVRVSVEEMMMDEEQPFS